MTESQNAEVIARFLEEVINQGRLEQADGLVAEDFVELDPLPGQRQGREGLKEVIGMLRSAFPDIHWTADETVASGDKVVYSLYVDGHASRRISRYSWDRQKGQREGSCYRSARGRQDGGQPNPDG